MIQKVIKERIYMNNKSLLGETSSLAIGQLVVYIGSSSTIGHKVISTKPLPKKAQDFHRGGKHPKHVLLLTNLTYFPPIGVTG